jgi:hypothetical protein
MRTKRPTFRPILESLEDRLCLSTLYANPTDYNGNINGAQNSQGFHLA